VPGVAPAWTDAEWVEDGTFLRQVTDRDPIPEDVPDAWRGLAPFPTVCLIGLNESPEEFTVLYADARGVHRVYQMTFDGREWTMSRRAPGMNQRFFGTLSGTGDRIDGRWEASADGEAWNLDFELTYTRQR
jgi:hypothetical protein